MTTRNKTTMRNALAGLAAEGQVAQKYVRSGFELLAQRFRKQGGEIDLVARHGQKLYFVEVKKSHSFDAAASRITRGQIERLRKMALHFLADHKLPIETEMRFDAALVNASGQIKVIPNAFC